MTASSVNFFQPGTEAAIDANAIARQRAMADLLMKRGQTPAEGQMVSGHYVAPGAASYVSQLVSALGGAYKDRQADVNEKQLMKDVQTKRVQEASDFMTALNGKPGQNVPLNVPNDDEGNPMPAAQSAALAPDRSRALALALQSQNPALQGMGGKLMEQQMNEQEMASALKAAGITPPTAAGAPAVPGGAPGAPSAPGGLLGGNAPGAGIPGVNPQAAALTMSRLPQLNKLGVMIQDASKPMAIAEGGTAYSPINGAMFTAPKTEAGIAVQTGKAAPIPGFAEAQARRDGLAEQAKYDAKLETRDVGGVPTTKTNAQWRDYYGGQQQSAPPAAGNSARTEGDMRMSVASGTDGTAAQYQKDISDIQKSLQQPNLDPASKQLLQGELQNRQGQLAKYFPQGAAPAGPMQGQSASDKEYATTRAQAFAKRASEIQSAASSAGSTLRNLDTLESLYKDPSIAKGGAAEGISSLKNYAASTGVDIKGLGAEQAVAAITNKMALDSRSTAEGGGMPGAMSDSDRNFLAAQQPGLSKTPEGRALIIDNSRKLAQRQVEVAKMAQAYEQKNGKIDAGFDRQLQEFADKNQMFKPQKGAGNIDALLNKYR